MEEQKVLTAERRKLLLEVCDALEALLEGMSELPALLHADLWRGNFLCLAEDKPAVFDPATYYGPREMELAYIELFGGFPSGFVEAYNTSYPLDEGYSQRRLVHQLYPLLVHYNIFGEPYGAQVEALCRAVVKAK